MTPGGACESIAGLGTTRGFAMANRDTHELITPSPRQFAGCDNFAISTGDAFALVGRVLLGLLFLMNSAPRLKAGLGGTIGYFTSLGMPAPEFFAWLSTAIEIVFGIALILGVATRYSALLLLVFTIIATALAHRYWQYPMPAQVGQYINFIKNLAIIGGLLLLFVTGAGRFSVDGWLRKRG
jgi:putative oxidoreductase